MDLATASSQNIKNDEGKNERENFWAIILHIPYGYGITIWYIFLFNSACGNVSILRQKDSASALPYLQSCLQFYTCYPEKVWSLLSLYWHALCCRYALFAIRRFSAHKMRIADSSDGQLQRSSELPWLDAHYPYKHAAWLLKGNTLYCLRILPPPKQVMSRGKSIWSVFLNLSPGTFRLDVTLQSILSSHCAYWPVHFSLLAPPHYFFSGMLQLGLNH